MIENWIYIYYTYYMRNIFFEWDIWSCCRAYSDDDDVLVTATTVHDVEHFRHGGAPRGGGTRMIKGVMKRLWCHENMKYTCRVDPLVYLV